MQLNLSFLEIPRPGQHLWANLDDKQRRDVTDKLSRLIAEAALADAGENNDGDARKESDDD